MSAKKLICRRYGVFSAVILACHRLDSRLQQLPVSAKKFRKYCYEFCNSVTNSGTRHPSRRISL